MAATKTDGTLWSWGHNTTGQLGINNSDSRSSPVQIPGTNWTADINCAGSFMTCSKTDSTLWAWGNNYGMLGLGDNARRSSPTQVPGYWGTGTVEFSSKGSHTVAYGSP